MIWGWGRVCRRSCWRSFGFGRERDFVKVCLIVIEKLERGRWWYLVVGLSFEWLCFRIFFFGGRDGGFF